MKNTEYVDISTLEQHGYWDDLANKLRIAPPGKAVVIPFDKKKRPNMVYAMSRRGLKVRTSKIDDKTIAVWLA